MESKQKCGKVEIVTALLLLIFPLASWTDAFADEAVIDSREIEVVAQRLQPDDVEYSSAISEGVACATLRDGTTVEVSEVLPDAVKLVVIPVQDPQAQSWVLSQVGSGVSDMRAFYIFFEDAEGNLIYPSGEIVSLTLPVQFDTPIVYSLLADGTKEVLHTFDVGQGLQRGTATTISFIANGSQYYVVGNKVNLPEPGPGNEQIGNADPSDRGESVPNEGPYQDPAKLKSETIAKTGDSCGLWAACFASVLALVVALNAALKLGWSGIRWFK